MKHSSNIVRGIPASIELPARQILDSPNLDQHIPRSTRVYIPDLAGDDEETRVRAAIRLDEFGLCAVPHVAARRLASRAILDNRMARLTGEAGVSDVLLIAGDPRSTTGEFASSFAVLESGLLDRYGITQIGIAGHPEGNLGMTEAQIMDALRLKSDLAARSDAAFRIVTQFGFDAAAFLAWADRLPEAGINLPVHLGVAGPARLTTLIKYAAACGVGNSIGFLRRRIGSLGGLMSGFSGEEIVAPIEQHLVDAPATPVTQIHVFAFGGLLGTAAWLNSRGSWHLERGGVLDASL